jgi:hypothetical protein
MVWAKSKEQAAFDLMDYLYGRGENERREILEFYSKCLKAVEAGPAAEGASCHSNAGAPRGGALYAACRT